MPVTQYFTKSRPDATQPFYEDTTEGKTRTSALYALADSRPELVSSRPQPSTNADALTIETEWTFPDVDAFREWLKLALETDPELRFDRARYYQDNGHSLLIEFMYDGLDRRGLISSITPLGAVHRMFDGSIIQKTRNEPLDM